MNIDEELARVGLTRDSYEAAMSDIADKMNGVQDIEWDEIIAKHGITLAPETLRRMAGKPFGGVFVKEYYQRLQKPGDELKALDLKLDQIRKEKVKLQTLNVERNRIDRNEARQELYYESVGRACEALPLPKFNSISPKKTSMTYLLTIADIHFNSEFTSAFNQYSPDICKYRFEKLLGWTRHFVDMHNIETLRIVSLGDDIQGLLRASDLKINDMSIVKSVVEVSRLIATFLNNLSQYVNVDYYHVPTANHTQTRPLGTKASEIPDEDLEYVIGHYIYDLLRMNERVRVNIVENGDQFIKIDIHDYDVYAMHGHQFKSGFNNALPNFESWLHGNVDYLILGHYHSGMEMVVGDRGTSNCEIIVAPGFVGSDPYSDSLFKGAKPACCIYGFDSVYGHTETYKCVF